MIKRWVLGSALLVLIFSFVMYANMGLPWEYLKAKENFNQHLSSYEIEMVLDELGYDFLHGGYHGKAHPKNNPDLQFYIGQNSRTNQIEDEYAYQRLRKRANREVKMILDKYLPNRILPEPEVEVVNVDTHALEINVETRNVVDGQTKAKIKQAIIEKGFKPEQLMFGSNDGI
ncbi:hypothetical protein GCM10009001_34630 [Virgibacillus siamensis]|uniref:Uncharacterized protein n=1 Tax=Virgibacillus siamensis TaxID=480071 RepID=A0ABN1GM84_9BACI